MKGTLGGAASHATSFPGFREDTRDSLELNSDCEVFRTECFERKSNRRDG